MNLLKKLWDLLVEGHGKQAYIDLYDVGTIDTEEMLEKTA